MRAFSIVLPVYGNEKNLPVTVPYMIDHLDLFSGYQVEIVLVCDCSPDASWEIMKKLKKEYPKIIKIINLERNFGQKMAIACGLEHAAGDVIGVISADLQDPFELFADMLTYWKKGYQLVAGRREQREDTGIGKYFSQLYHWMVRICIDSRYPTGGFDFFLIDGRCVQGYLRKTMRYTRMQLTLLECTQKQYFIGYKRRQRKIGKSGFSLSKKINIVIYTFGMNTDCVFRSFATGGLISAALSLAAAGIFYTRMELRSLQAMLCIVQALLSSFIAVIGIAGTHLYKCYKKACLKSWCKETDAVGGKEMFSKRGQKNG